MSGESWEELERRAAEANEAYESNTALRTLVAGIPGIGGALDVLFASEGQKVTKARQAKLVSDIREEMQSIAEESIDREYLRSEEFFDLTIEGLEAAAKTRDEEKIRLYARVLTNATVHTKRDENHFPEEYLQILSTLSPKQVEVARLLYEQRPGVKREEWQLWKETASSTLHIREEDLPLMLSRLEATGLLVGHSIDGTWGSLESPPKEPSYQVTSSFERLMNFLDIYPP